MTHAESWQRVPSGDEIVIGARWRRVPYASHASSASRTSTPQSINWRLQMRTLLLASTALIVAACSDNPQPTSPRSISSATSGAGDRAPATSTISQTYSRPTDQVGFTKTVSVSSPPKTIPGGVPGASFGSATVLCPSGTVLVGGGYMLTLTPGGTWPLIAYSVPHSVAGIPDGWVANVQNQQPGAADVTLSAYAICAS